MEYFIIVFIGVLSYYFIIKKISKKRNEIIKFDNKILQIEKDFKTLKPHNIMDEKMEEMVLTEIRDMRSVITKLQIKVSNMQVIGAIILGGNSVVSILGMIFK